MATGLTKKQLEDLNRSIIGYLELEGHDEAAQALSSKLSLTSDPQSKDALPRKWRSILRLQKKITDLETEVSDLRSRGPVVGSTRSGAPRDTLPRPTPLLTLEGHKKPVTSMIYHSILSHLVTSSSDGSVRVWDLPSGSLLRVVANGHTDSVTSLALDPDMRILATASADLSLKLWSADGDYKCIRTLQGHSHTVTGVTFYSRTGLASCSHDGTLRLWDTQTGFCSRVLRAGRWVRCVAAPVGSNHALYYAGGVSTGHKGHASRVGASGGRNGSLLDYANAATRRQAPSSLSSSSAMISSGDIGTSTPLADLTPQQPASNAAAAGAGAADKPYIPIVVTGDNEGIIAVWDVRVAAGPVAGSTGATGNAGEPILLLSGHEGPVQCVVVVDDACLDRHICTSFGLRYSLADTAETDISPSSSTGSGAAETSAVAAVMTCRFIFSAGRDKTLRLWDRYSAECIFELECGNWVSDIQLHPNNKYVFVCGDDRLVRVLDSSKRMREVARVPVDGFAGHMQYCIGLDLLCVGRGDGRVSVMQCQDAVEALLKNKKMF